MRLCLRLLADFHEPQSIYASHDVSFYCILLGGRNLYILKSFHHTKEYNASLCLSGLLSYSFLNPSLESSLFLCVFICDHTGTSRAPKDNF